jgi:DNA-binding NarL/FixJ family response regulator
VVRRLLIVDDNPIVRHALCMLFTQETDFEVCGETENRREAIEKALWLKPDLIVTDLSMPIMNGLEEARLLKQLIIAIALLAVIMLVWVFEREVCVTLLGWLEWLGDRL